MTERDRLIFDNPRASEDELWSLIEGKSREEIVRDVSDAFSAELAEIMKRQKAKERRSS